MKKLLKDQWVDALLSGQYTQGYIGLYNKENKSFCPLGVLCDIIAHEYPYVLQVDLTLYNPWTNGEFMVRGWSSSISGIIYLYGLGSHVQESFLSVIEMNDMDKLPFTDIAQWINTHIQGI